MGFEVTAAVDTWSGRRDSEGFEVRGAADARSGRRNFKGFEVRAAAETWSGRRDSEGFEVRMHALAGGIPMASRLGPLLIRAQARGNPRGARLPNPAQPTHLAQPDQSQIGLAQ